MMTRYRKKIQNKILSRKCTICLAFISPKDKVSICCGVKCHKKCLHKWLKISPNCPICKCRIEKNDATDIDWEENMEKNMLEDINKIINL